MRVDSMATQGIKKTSKTTAELHSLSKAASLELLVTRLENAHRQGTLKVIAKQGTSSNVRPVRVKPKGKAA